MLDGPGMVYIPESVPGEQERHCISCGERITPQHGHLVL